MRANRQAREKAEDAGKQGAVWPFWGIRKGILAEEVFKLGHLVGEHR